MKNAYLSFLIMLILASSFGFGIYIIFASVNFPTIQKQMNPQIVTPLTDVEEDPDVVHVLLLFQAADYFVYKGVPIGFQYEMLKELEKELGRNIDIFVDSDINNIQKQLNKNVFDIVIMDFSPSGFILPQFERSITHSFSHPVLVSGNMADTAGVYTILVSNDFRAMLFFTNDSPFVNYSVQRNNNHSTEELFEKLDNGEIPYIICDYNQAITLIPFYSNVKILDKAGPQFERRWLLNKKNIQLNEDINHWLLDYKKTYKYRALLSKYFSQESTLINKSFAKNQKKGISQYDDIIKKYAAKYDFDWRFIASIIYQETNFVSGLTGKGGSYGLMQLMPVTMDYYGISEEDDDETNIRVGVQHLQAMTKSFEEVDDEYEKLFFVAAAYNAGRGHIFDAQRLCAKYEGDYTDWKEVSKYLILKSKQEYATDPVVKSGYFPGAFTVKYTQQVMERYVAYKAAYN